MRLCKWRLIKCWIRSLFFPLPQGLGMPINPGSICYLRTQKRELLGIDESDLKQAAKWHEALACPSRRFVPWDTFLVWASDWSFPLTQIPASLLWEVWWWAERSCWTDCHHWWWQSPPRPPCAASPLPGLHGRSIRQDTGQGISKFLSISGFYGGVSTTVIRRHTPQSTQVPSPRHLLTFSSGVQFLGSTTADMRVCMLFGNKLTLCLTN